jgi:hypothetical protein
MEGDALTAEQIVKHVRTAFPSYSDVLALGGHIRAQERENAALRDRLARMEEQPSVRYELVKENNESTDWDEGDFPPPYREWWMIYRYETVTKEQRDFGKMYFSEESARAALAALSTPTDGAAPARRDGEGSD